MILLDATESTPSGPPSLISSLSFSSSSSPSVRRNISSPVVPPSAVSKDVQGDSRTQESQKEQTQEDILDGNGGGNEHLEEKHVETEEKGGESKQSEEKSMDAKEDESTTLKESQGETSASDNGISIYLFYIKFILNLY